jgi:23S rRNA pseudouridine1911/1915/1917 synthase
MSTVNEPAPLLKFLLGALPGWKRATVKDRLKRGAVSVNGVVVTRHDYVLGTGDRVEVLPLRMVPVNYDRHTGIRVLYDDQHLVVIDKPAGLLSVATEMEHEQTAMHQTRRFLRDRGARRSQRLWAVHRLDQETSGALMFAKSRAVQRHFRENWKQVGKIYVAIVEGSPSPPSGKLATRLREGKDLRVYAEEDRATSKAAVTRYRTIGTTDREALLELSLETGKKHQIRVHLAAAGHPVVGDPLYGTGRDPLGRLALHSHRLSFTHPYTHEMISIVSPLPKPMEDFVKRRRHWRGDPAGKRA